MSIELVFCDGGELNYDIANDSFSLKCPVDRYFYHYLCYIKELRGSKVIAIYICLTFNDTNRIEWELDDNMKKDICLKIIQKIPKVYDYSCMYNCDYATGVKWKRL